MICSSPTSGSFVKRSKVNFGCDLMSAIRKRYCPQPSEDVGFVNEQHKMGCRVIEFVKMDKIAGKQKYIFVMFEV